MAVFQSRLASSNARAGVMHASGVDSSMPRSLVTMKSAFAVSPAARMRLSSKSEYSPLSIFAISHSANDWGAATPSSIIASRHAQATELYDSFEQPTPIWARLSLRGMM